MLERSTDEYLKLDNHEVLTELQTDGHRGLDSEETNRRLEEYGPNEIASDRKKVA